MIGICVFFDVGSWGIMGNNGTYLLCNAVRGEGVGMDNCWWAMFALVMGNDRTYLLVQCQTMTQLIAAEL